jgi:hypothetical protein
VTDKNQQACPHCGLIATEAHLHILGIKFPALNCGMCDTVTPDYSGIRGWLLDRVFLRFWDGSTHLEAQR